MDETDRRILKALSSDARIPASQIARDIGLSRVTVANRIDKMRASGIIRGLTHAPGTNESPVKIEALLLLQLDAGDSRPLVARMKRTAEVRAIRSVNGDFDFALEIATDSTAELDEVLATLRSIPGVARTKSVIYLKRFL